MQNDPGGVDDATKGRTFLPSNFFLNSSENRFFLDGNRFPVAKARSGLFQNLSQAEKKERFTGIFLELLRVFAFQDFVDRG